MLDNISSCLDSYFFSYFLWMETLEDSFMLLILFGVFFNQGRIELCTILGSPRVYLVNTMNIFVCSSQHTHLDSNFYGMKTIFWPMFGKEKTGGEAGIGHVCYFHFLIYEPLDKASLCIKDRCLY